MWNEPLKRKFNLKILLILIIFIISIITISNEVVALSKENPLKKPSTITESEVLVLTTVSEIGFDQYEGAVLSSFGIQYDYEPIGLSTPTLITLQSYSVVFIYISNQPHDSIALGNVLADYLDGGGAAVVSSAAFTADSIWDIEGRFINYAPFVYGPLLNAFRSYDGLSTHPIFNNVSDINSTRVHDLSLAEGAITIASWTNGYPFVAIKDNVIGISSLANTAFWEGDLGKVWANSISYLLSDHTSPTLTNPSDISFNEETTGKSISWIANDPNPGDYFIYKDSVEIENDSWISDDPITISVDGLEIGSYNYTIVVFDESNNTNTDTVIVTVTEATTTTTTTITTTITATSTLDTSDTAETTSKVATSPGFTFLTALSIAIIYLITKKFKKPK